MCDFGIFEFARLSRKNSGGALKQLAILNAGQIQKLFPKSHNVVRKTPFSISTAYTETEHIFENYSKSSGGGQGPSFCVDKIPYGDIQSFSVNGLDNYRRLSQSFSVDEERLLAIYSMPADPQ